MRYIVNLSYDGSGFCGWQIQPDAKTVQECLENALSTILRERISVTGAGRTDTGVNACGYIAHFDCQQNIWDTAQIRYKLNAILPKSMVIHSLAQTADDFHARFDATRREYTYFLHRTKDPFIENYSWLYAFPDIDFEMMNRAAALLTGTHDFCCFQKTGSDVKTSVCTVYEAFWQTYTPSHVAVMGDKDQQGDSYWYFRISADRFLRNMVRAVTGTLLEVGRGRRTVEEFGSLILPPESHVPGNLPGRCSAGESVPGHALFLSKINY